MKKPVPPAALRSRRLAFEPLEPRALLSADLLPIEPLPDPLPPLPAEFRVAETALVPTARIAAPSPRELVIIDAGVAGAGTLAAEWTARGFAVLQLDAGADALAQIGAALAERQGLDAVHLVTHGTTDGIALGGAMLDAAALSARSVEIARWADAFAADGDLLLYACDVGGAASGEAFLERLAMLTGADVAASADATGAALLGGDWDLEYALGAIESDALDSADWQGLLSQTIDWSAVTWTPGDLGPVAIAVGALGNVTVTVTGDVAELDGGSPEVASQLEGGFGGTAGSSLDLSAGPNGFLSTQSVDVVFDFSALPGEVTNLSFYVFDIDVSGGGNGFIDRVTVTANGGALNPTTVTGTGVANASDGVNTVTGQGNNNSPNPSGNGNGFFAFSQRGLVTLKLNYGNANAADRSQQGIGLNTITFDLAPVNTWPASVSTAEDTAFAFSGGNALSVSDDDANLVTLSAGNGALALTASGGAVLGGSGATRTISGSLADINATLATLVYTPTANFNGGDTLTIVSSDGTYSDTDSVTITVTAVNDAPALDASRSPVLGAIVEDAPAPVGAVGTLVSSLVDFASPSGQVDNVTDADASPQLGIALVGVDGSQGTWFYSLNNGANWTAVPAVAANNALLLAADGGTRLYFQPNANFSGTLGSAITFRAWDGTTGAAGTLVNPGGGGGSSAFSVATDTASLTVTGVNDAPTLSNLAGDARSYAAGSGAVTVDQSTAATATDPDSPDFDGGTLTVSIVAGEVAAEDVLAIAVNAPALTLSAGMTVGSTVSVNGVAVGILTADGTGGNDLVVALNANATAARVDTLLRAVTYANTDAASPTPGTRTLRFQLTDGDGGSSAAADATVTVKPVVSIAANDAAAGEPGNAGQFTVTLSAASATNTVVSYTVTGTAANGTDYTLLTSPVTILAGSTSAVIDIGVIDDLAVEASETVTITLTGIAGGDADIRVDGTADDATVTIADNDTATLTVGDVVVNEGAGTITFSVSVDRAVQGGFSVDVLFAGGSAGAGTDFTAAAQTLAFAGTAGETLTVTRAITDDAVVEATETFSVSLANLVPVSAPPGSFNLADTATGTIVDNDTATLSVGDVTVNEAAGTITFTVSVDRAVDGGFAIDALFAGASAVGGTDFANASQTLAFAGTAGESHTVIRAITDDAIVEATETFTVSLANLVAPVAPPASILFTDTATGTILDNDTATLTVGDVTVNEAAGTITFSVAVDLAVDGGFSVDVLFAGLSATAGSDFGAATETLAFAGTAGETLTVTRAITDDAIVEADETFAVSLANVAAPVVPPVQVNAADTAIGTITNNDAAALTIGDVSVDEADGTISFSVVLDRAVQGGLSVDVLFGGGTAGAGTDYDATSQTLAFAGTAGETLTVIRAVTDDPVVEANETFTVSLANLLTASAPPAAIDTSDTAIGTVVDNDTATLSIGDVTVNEGAGTISFLVSVDRAVQGGFAIDAVFGGGTANAGGDYAAATQTIAFAGALGESHLVTVAVADDAIVEAAETFTVSLANLSPVSAPPGAFTYTDTAVGTILDNDSATITVGDAAVSEDGGSISFLVSVDLEVQGGFSIDAVFTDISATAGVDYAGATQTLVFAGAAGETQVVTLALGVDPLVEADETFTVSLANLVPATAPGTSFTYADTGLGTILNDDSAPTLADAVAPLPENSTAATLVIDFADALTGTDADPDGDAITYSIIAGNGAGAFAIDASTGALTVANPAPLDFETTPTFVLTVLASDGTNSDTATLTVNLQNVNEAPTVAAPAARTVAEDTAMSFSVGGGNAIIVGDADAASLQVTLASAQGALTLASLAGLTFSVGDGVADGSMTFLGSSAAVNAALDGLGYLAATNYNGADVITVLVEDLGQSGLGGPLTATGNVAVTVTAVNDAPTIGGDLALLVLEGQSVTLLSADVLGLDVDDAGAGLVFEVVAAPGHGYMAFADAPTTAITTFTQADLDAGRVRYVHDGSETTADAFTLRLADGGEDGAAPDFGTLDVVVVPVNDTPALYTGAAGLDAGTRIVLTPDLVWATDPDDALDSLLFTLDGVQGGYVELGSAQGVPIASFTGAQLNAGLVRFVQSQLFTAPAFNVSVSDGQAVDGPRAVVLTLRSVAGLQNDAPLPGDAGIGGLSPLNAFREDTPRAQLRTPDVVGFLREPVISTAGPTLAEPQPAAPAPRPQRIAGAVVENPRIEVAAAGLRFEAPAPGEINVPRVDFTFQPVRHDIDAPREPTPLGLDGVDAVRVAGLALTAGGVWWIFRMGSLIGSALVSAPAWRHIDPLPVLGGGRERVEWDAPDEVPPEEDADAPERYFDGDAPNSPRR